MSWRRKLGACTAIAVLGAASGLAAAAQGDAPPDPNRPAVTDVATATVVNVETDAPTTLTFVQATLPPGEALRPRRLAGPVLIIVREGELVVGGPRRQWVGGTSRVRAGGQAVLPTGAYVRLRNDGETPTTFDILSLEPRG